MATTTGGAGHRLAAESLAQLWRLWILRLRDQETRGIEAGDELLLLAQTALARGEREAARELLAESRDLQPGDAEVLWLLFSMLELVKNRARAEACYREFLFRESPKQRRVPGHSFLHGDDLRR